MLRSIRSAIIRRVVPVCLLSLACAFIGVTQRIFKLSLVMAMYNAQAAIGRWVFPVRRPQRSIRRIEVQRTALS